ncbi:ATP-binding protein [Sandarakinorhabdus sp. DWP1-3-1]|uniref:ATP-binding protein n=1 Tax=Sandarakinorhabdus sp. DWP1-3-1 TaxID=2804627 RepID=UPI003CFA4943
MTGLAWLWLALVAVAAFVGGRLSVRRQELAEPEPSPPPVPEAVPADRISVEALGDPALIVDGDIAVAANAEARRLFGDRVDGGDLRLTVRNPIILDAIAEARASSSSIERELSGLGNGNAVYRLRVVDTGDGRQLLLFDDITQARLTERMRVDFVANASHELRTPLATLSGFVETLQGPAAEDEPARHRFLDIMAREAARMSRLIDDLLSLSRIELDKHVRPVAQLQVAGIVADVGKTLAMRLDGDERQLVIEERLPLPPVVADRDQILQVLHNLVSNALKYGRNGTPITVVVEAEAASAARPAVVRISVTDISEGIAPEHLPRLTERFYRIDSQRSRKMGGTGLGLAIVKHIVERHRGRLEIESRAGEGTTVSFTLPQA